MSLIRGTALQGFGDLVRELGADPEELLRLAHLDPDGVGNHDSYLDYRGVIGALESAARVTGAGDFGRRLGDRQGLEILGPLGVAARTAPTVGAAMASIEKYMAVYSPAIAITVTWAPGEELARFEWRVVAARPPAHRQAAELALGVSCQVFRLLAGPSFTPCVVRIRHQPLTAVEAYQDHFGCPVEFATGSYGFSFPVSVLALPLDADSAVHAVVEEYLDTVAVPHSMSTVENVRRLVRTMLPTGGLTLELVCGQLAVHPRTLQRDLAKRGTSFAALVDEVRREEAERYLCESEMPLGQLAGVLGLSEQSALTRACHRWFGRTPSRVRAQT
ncbi:AraC family transcriptional regulator [Nocardioides albidus]|uniref:AraC family transcriptional regulator n=1 Tax=Nocardioides albidus TaxID=1517589 RepID=A0A5C4W1D1_9ACTN|nr:AraC family transcriptional regulator [Nocardioides albidus]TNM41988.1 AraC family transcriptional regulator [Nocardioides albidus]